MKIYCFLKPKNYKDISCLFLFKKLWRNIGFWLHTDDIFARTATKMRSKDKSGHWVDKKSSTEHYMMFIDLILFTEKGSKHSKMVSFQ